MLMHDWLHDAGKLVVAVGAFAVAAGFSSAKDGTVTGSDRALDHLDVRVVDARIPLVEHLERSGPKNCGECETIGENHRYNGGFNGWFCRLLEDDVAVAIGVVSSPRSAFGMRRTDVPRIEGEADCYKCEGGDGCHVGVLNTGTCDSWHPYCPVGPGESMVQLAVENAVRIADYSALSYLAASHAEQVLLNWQRGMLQLLDCKGLVVAQYEVSHLFALRLHVSSNRSDAN